MDHLFSVCRWPTLHSFPSRVARFNLKYLYGSCTLPAWHEWLSVQRCLFRLVPSFPGLPTRYLNSPQGGLPSLKTFPTQTCPFYPLPFGRIARPRDGTWGCPRPTGMLAIGVRLVKSDSPTRHWAPYSTRSQDPALPRLILGGTVPPASAAAGLPGGCYETSFPLCHRADWMGRGVGSV